MDLEEEFKRAYPNLAEELEGSESTAIEGVRTEEEQAERAAARLPTVTDHLKRCESEDEALEIIDFFVESGEIPGDHGDELKRQLVTRGLRSFGEKREPGEIEKDGL